MKSVYRCSVLAGGWRKECFLLENKDEKLVKCRVDKKKISKDRFFGSIKMEIEFGKRGLPVREFVMSGEGDKHFWVVWKYIEGKPKWRWDKKDSYCLGGFCGKMHKMGLFHMDLKPGNILWRGDEIVGLLDFEEARKEVRWKIRDLANTLSWILVSGGSGRAFLRGYGAGVRDDKMEKFLEKYLKKRMTEGNNGAFLVLAKRRLDDFKREVDGKLIGLNDLARYRRENKNKKVVFAVGAFELLHWGHIKFLERIKKAGDLLVLGVMSDASRKRIEGEVYSIIGERTRAETLGYFTDLVDKVVIVEGNDIRLPLKKLKPDVLVVSKKDLRRGVRRREEMDLVELYGGRVWQVEHSSPRMSSSQMIKRVAQQKINQVLMVGDEQRPILRPEGVIKNRKMVKMKDLTGLREGWRKKGKTVVFTSLSADLFHVGHARFIQKAKSLADVLIVGVPSNRSLSRLKGPGRPIVDEKARVMVLAALPCVDRVVIFSQMTILECLRRLKPDVFFTVKEDWNRGLAQSPEAGLIESIGGKIVRSERMAPYISASLMINKAAGEVLKEVFVEVLRATEENPMINADFDPFDPANQLTAREKGFYDKVLSEVGKKGKCVFCDLKDRYIIEEEDGVVLTVALYPYIDGHLLIIPRRHVETADELTEKEWGAVYKLQVLAKRLLRGKLGIKNFWFLVREGDGIAAGKTVRHLHYHVLPYDAGVIKMGETKLSMMPLEVSKKLKGKKNDK